MLKLLFLDAVVQPAEHVTQYGGAFIPAGRIKVTVHPVALLVSPAVIEFRQAKGQKVVTGRKIQQFGATAIGGAVGYAVNAGIDFHKRKALGTEIVEGIELVKRFHQVPG